MTWFDRLTNRGGCHSGLDPESVEGRGWAYTDPESSSGGRTALYGDGLRFGGRDFFMRPTPPWNPFSCRAAAMSGSEGWKGGDEGHGRSD